MPKTVKVQNQNSVKILQGNKRLAILPCCIDNDFMYVLVLRKSSMSKVQTLQNVFIELALLANFPEVKIISIELEVEVETVIGCIRGQIGDEALMDKIVQASKNKMMEGVKATSEVYTKDVREVCDMLKVATECYQQLWKLFGGLRECFTEIDKRLQSLEQLGSQIIRVQ